MCHKNSHEVGTQLVDLFNTVIVDLFVMVVFMFYPIHNIITMLETITARLSVM